jgi:hypothetical protein
VTDTPATRAPASDGVVRPRPERIAAGARALAAELDLTVALHADALARSLEREHGLVAWDREQLIGQLQRRLAALREQRSRELGGPNVRVIERRRQPLESIDLAWRHLRRGRRVRIEHEPGACTAALDLMRLMARVLRDAVGADVLDVASPAWDQTDVEPSASSSAFRIAVEHPDDPMFWPIVGPRRSAARVAVVEANADRELAAYVLARASLRRTGVDPRNVKLAYVIGLDDRLRRHLQRLWVGATMGPADDPGSFTGPVDASVRDAFLDANAAWGAQEGVEVLCPGCVLERAADPQHYLAPALFVTDWPVPELPTPGPMLVLVRCDEQQALAGAEAAAREGGQIIALGGKKNRYPGDVRLIRGALLVERLPPGLPEPRPV